MKKLSYIGLSRLLLLLTALLAHSSFASAEKTIMVFGDSLSAAYHLELEAGWPYLLQQKLKRQKRPWQVINFSISGETTQGGLLRFKQDLAKAAPDIVILELGANDGLRGQSLKQMRANLAQMIVQAQNAKAKVILAGMHIPPNYGKRYTSAFHKSYIDLSQQYNTVLIPFLLADIATKPELLLNDGLHPNTEGQQQMLINLWPYLAPLL